MKRYLCEKKCLILSNLLLICKRSTEAVASVKMKSTNLTNIQYDSHSADNPCKLISGNNFHVKFIGICILRNILDQRNCIFKPNQYVANCMFTTLYTSDITDVL